MGEEGAGDHVLWELSEGPEAVQTRENLEEQINCFLILENCYVYVQKADPGSYRKVNIKELKEHFLTIRALSNGTGC